MTILILGAGGAAGINFCRALRRAGDNFRLIATDVHPLRLRLPDADAYELVPKVAERDPELLATLVKRHAADVVYAQADSEVRGLLQHPRPIPAKTLLPKPSAWDIASNKLELCHHLFGHRVPVPVSRLAVGPEAKEDFGELRELGRGRVWVRAKTGAGSKAALPVTTFDQMQHWIDYWCDSRGLHRSDFMQCQYLPGDEFAWQGVYDAGGNLLGSVVRQRVEYVFAEQMPSGQSSTPSVATIVHRTDVNTLAERAVAALGLPTGVYGVDCKTDAAGVVRVTEINVGRFYTTSDFYASAGANLPAAWTLAAAGESVTLGRDRIPAGVTWVRSLDREALLMPAGGTGGELVYGTVAL